MSESDEKKDEEKKEIDEEELIITVEEIEKVHAKFRVEEERSYNLILLYGDPKIKMFRLKADGNNTLSDLRYKIARDLIGSSNFDYLVKVNDTVKLNEIPSEKIYLIPKDILIEIEKPETKSRFSWLRRS